MRATAYTVHLSMLRQEFRHRPYPIRDPRCHCGHHVDGAADAAKIVVGEVKREYRAEIFPLLAEGVRQAGETLALSAQRSVLTFEYVMWR